MKKKSFLEKKGNIPKESNPFSHSPADLFARSPDQDYMREWTESLIHSSSIEDNSNTLSVLVFRLAEEWLALATVFIKEVTPQRQVHSIPHHHSHILQGFVNLNGELKLYVALHELIGIEGWRASDVTHLPYQSNRMLAILKEEELWVFPVDEIDGIYNWNLLELENVPVNLFKSAINYIRGIMKMGNKSVGLLDDELLFSSLRRSLQ